MATLRIVYYGPPGAGKTTNLQRVSAFIHGSAAGRITPRQVGENRVASLEIPLGPLGPLFGSSVVVRLETMQGEVSSAGQAWSAVLADADGIVFVADSSPHARIANVRALAGIRERLEGRGRTAASIPVVMQWNKRDGDDARPIAELETELNHGCFPSVASSSRRDTGVAETLIEILKRTINAAHRRAGGSAPAEAELVYAVMAAIERLSQSAKAESIEQFGMTVERGLAAWTQVREAAYSAESLDREPQETRMLAALERAASALSDQTASGLPSGLMAGLLAGCDRARGSLLLPGQGTAPVDERVGVPSGGEPPALSVPLSFGGVTFGSMVVYVAKHEQPPTPAEQAYWTTAARLTSVYLAWQAGENRPVAPRRKGSAPGLEPVEHLDS